MKIDEKVIERLNQLINNGADLGKTRQQGLSNAGMFTVPYDYINKELANQWGVV